MRAKSGTKRTRTPSLDQPESSIHSRKRVKDASNEPVEEKTDHEVESPGYVTVQRKPNRLQRAVAKELKRPKGSTTATQAKKIKKAEKNAGILSNLLDAPVDIFYEITLHLAPADLLSMSRVSGQLRSLLLSKNSRHIWSTSLSFTGLPPCPEDINEPQYASLVFDTDCNACGSPYAKTAHYELRIRLCKECFDLNVLPAETVLAEFDLSSECIDEISRLLPKAEFKSNDKEINEVNRFYEPDLFDVATEYVSDSCDPEILKEERLRLRDTILKHTKLVQAWENERTLNRKSELSDLGKSHANAVLARLRGLGYTNEDWKSKGSHYEDMKFRDQFMKLICQKKQLTERTWKNLSPKLEELIITHRKEVRRYDRREEFKTAYHNYIDSLNLTFGEKGFMPLASDLITIQKVAEFLYHDDGHRAITEEVWSSFFPTVQRLCCQKKREALRRHENAIINWRAEHKRELENIGDNPNIIFASSFFFDQLDSFDDELYYFITPHSIVTSKSESPSQEERRRNMHWSSFKIYNVDYDVPDALLSELGIPLETTMESIQAMGICFCCRRCDVICQKPMGWTELVKHYLDELRHDACAARKKTLLRRNNVKYIEDHCLKGGNLVRVMDQSEIASYNEKEIVPITNANRKQCGICSRLHFGMSKYNYNYAEVEAHVRKKHGKIAELEDIVDGWHSIAEDFLENMALLDDE